ncbi:MAG: DUF6382 domain-containing protein [Lachnospiraceae bacterium]
MISKEKVEYQRSINHNYLIVKEEAKDINFDDINMLMENRFKTLLGTELRQEEGEDKLFYEISSLQSVYRIFEYKSLSLDDIFCIFCGILSAVDETELYLLSEDAIVLEPEYIFMNMEQKEVKFLYYPKENQDFIFSIRGLAEYILEKVNHQDETAVAIGYRFYKIVQNENFVLDEIRQLMQSKEKTSKKEEHREETTEVKIEGIKGNEIENEIGKERWKDRWNKKEEVWNKREDVNLVTKGKDLWNLEEKRKPEGKWNPEEKKYQTRKKWIGKFGGALLLLFFGFCYWKNIFGLVGTQRFIFLALWIVGLAAYVYLVIFKKQNASGENIENGWEMGIDRDTDRKTDRKTDREAAREKERETETKSEKEALQFSYFNETEGIESKPEEYGKTMYIVKSPQEEERILVEEKSGKTYRLNNFGDCILIGKLKEQVDILLEEKSVSRIHARILKENQKLWIEDMQSTNGTFLNGIQLDVGERMPLEAEDRIEIGKIVLVYR